MNLNRVSASNRPAVKNDFKKRNGSRERDSFYSPVPIITFQENVLEILYGNFIFQQILA